MLSWADFEAEEPQLAEAGRLLLYHFGVGLAFLATTRKDGAPRLHPICVIQASAGLYGLIIPSPKLRDIRRDGRFALHSYPLEDNEDAFYVSGKAEVRDDPALRASVIDALIHEPGRQGPPLNAAHFTQQTVIEFLLDTCVVTRTTGHGDPAPRHTVWKLSA